MGSGASTLSPSALTVTLSQAKTLLGDEFDRTAWKLLPKIATDGTEETVKGEVFTKAMEELYCLLQISQVSCTNLPSSWTERSQDPYVTFLAGPSSLPKWSARMTAAASSSRSRTSTTPAISNDNSPNYGAWTGLINISNTDTPSLSIRVFDDDDVTADDILCTATIPLPLQLPDAPFNVPLSADADGPRITFTLKRISMAKSRCLSHKEKTTLKIIDQSALQGFEGFEGIHETGAALSLDHTVPGTTPGAFSLVDAATCCKLSELAYMGTDLWASKKAYPFNGSVSDEDIVAHYDPRNFSPNLRWQVGDLELAGRLGVKTLDDSYNVVVNGTTITNGILVHQATDQQGMILLSADKSRVYVIFRGTDMDKGTKAAIRDVCPSVVGFVTPTATDPTTASPSDDVLMHTGMCDLFDNMKEAVLQTVGKVLGEVETVKEIVVTGHSLGGALATIFTKGIYEHFPQVQDKSVHLTGYTYGGYGLGNKAWKEEFDGKIPNFYRCVNNKDVVPNLTKTWHNYYHVGKLCFMTDKTMIYDMENFEVEDEEMYEVGGEEKDEGGIYHSHWLHNHKCCQYGSLLGMYEAIMGMSPEEEKSCASAWKAYLTGKGATVSVSRSVVGSSVVFRRDQGPDLEAMYEELGDLVTNNHIEIGGVKRAVEAQELELVLRQVSYERGIMKFIGSEVGGGGSNTNAVDYMHFLNVCFSCLVSKDNARRKSTVEEAVITAKFNKFDKNMDGYLDKDEFKALWESDKEVELEEEDANELMKDIDIDKNDLISTREYIIFVLCARGKRREESKK